MFVRKAATKLVVLIYSMAAAAALGGCDKKMWILQYPQFYTQDLQTVAVLPFENETLHSEAGKIVAKRLAKALRENGTYKVLDMGEPAPAGEQDVKSISPRDVGAALRKLRKLGNVQALVTGMVTAFSAVSYSETWGGPSHYRYGYRYHHGRTRIGYHGFAYWDDYYILNEGTVTVRVALIGVPEGETIFETPTPVRARVRSRGYPPDLNPEACLLGAADKAARRLVERLAIVRKEVKVNPDRDLRTARDFRDNRWRFTDDFRADDEQMFVVLRLPPSCDRNPFRLAITREDQDQELSVQRLVWSRQHSRTGKGFPFSPKEIAKLAGPGEYEVRFYSGENLVMRREFEIKHPRKTAATAEPTNSTTPPPK